MRRLADVDLLDFTDARISEDTNGRNAGPTMEEAHASPRVPRDDRLPGVWPRDRHARSGR